MFISRICINYHFHKNFYKTIRTAYWTYCRKYSHMSGDNSKTRLSVYVNSNEKYKSACLFTIPRYFSSFLSADPNFFHVACTHTLPIDMCIEKISQLIKKKLFIVIFIKLESRADKQNQNAVISGSFRQ